MPARSSSSLRIGNRRNIDFRSPTAPNHRSPCGLASRRGSRPSWEGRGPYPGCEISSLLNPRNSARSEYVHSASKTVKQSVRQGFPINTGCENIDER
jgi:hypothetical protein